MAENQVYLIKSGQNSFVEETQAIVGISGGKVGIGTTVPESFFHVAGDTQIDGDLTVKGNFTTIESTTIQVDDKNIELGVGSTTDVAADGGGITLHGATNKTFNWSGNNSAWTSSEHLYLANGKHFSADELRALDADGLKLADQTTSGILIKDGKVGIHQASPAYDLDVSGSGNFDSLYIQGNSVLTGDGSIFGKWEDGATAGEIYYNEGNVGVGTIDPSAQLHVVGSTMLSGIVSASGINAIDAGGLTLGDDAGNGIFVEDGGQVGVNTITPNYNLHVNGTAHVGDNFSVGGDISGSAIKAIDANGLTLGDDAGNGIFVEDGGQVGVNTITPNYNLHVNGTAHVGDNFSVGGDISGSAIKAIDANGLTLGDDAGNGIFVEDGGQVGIGTTTPGYNLDVVGNGNFSQGLYVNGNSVLTGSAADLGKWDEGANSKIFYNDGNVGVGTSDPSVKFEVVGDSLFNGDLSVGSAFSVSANGSVGGILPSVGKVIGWDGSNWRPITSAGGGGSSSEVPEAFVQSLASGQSEYTINFTQTYDSAPAISTDLQIDGAGDIIPYAISEVTTSGYSISFAKDLPNDNYKIHTNFGGRDVFWTTGALGSINYSGGDVSIQDSLSVGANLTVQGNAVLTGSAADLGKWDEGAGSEIYYSDGNVGVGTSNPSYTLHVNGTIYNENGGINVANKFNVSTLGAVGGQSPAFNEVIKWDGSKWIAGSAPGGGTASSSEVPSAFDTWLTAGSTLHPITFVDAPEGGYQSIPSISTDVEIVDGDIIPYAISGVSTTGYYAVFSDPIPSSNNYKIHTTFGGKEVYWKTGAGGSSIYYDGDSVSVDDLVVGGNLTVNGTTTTVNTQTVEIEDHNLVIAANTGYNQLTSEYPGAGGAYAGILWGTGDAGAASPVKLTYQTNKGFAFEGGNVGIGTTNPSSVLHIKGPNNTTFDNISNIYSEGTDAYDSQNAGGGILFGGKYDSGGSSTVFAQISGIKENTTDGDYNGALTFGARDGSSLSMEAMRISSAGNVGIGTTNPSAKLSIHTSGATAKGLQVRTDNGDADSIRTVGGGGDNDVKFIVKGSGNVGIGTTNPTAKLDIRTTSQSSGNILNLTWDHYNTTTDIEQKIAWLFGDDYTVAPAATTAYIGCGKLGTFGTQQQRQSYLSFATEHGPNQIGLGGSEPNYTPVERMRIDSSGNLLLATAASQNDTTHLLTVGAYGRNGNGIYIGGYSANDMITLETQYDTSYGMKFMRAGSVLGYVSIRSAYGAEFHNNGSDERLKENIQTWEEDVCSKFKNIKPKTFNYIRDENKETVKGFIAQDMIDKFPEAYPYNEEQERYFYCAGNMVVYLMKAIQEQQQIIEQLQSQNASLAAQNADFESRISQLEQ